LRQRREEGKERKGEKEREGLSPNKNPGYVPEYTPVGVYLNLLPQVWRAHFAEHFCAGILSGTSTLSTVLFTVVNK